MIRVLVFDDDRRQFARLQGELSGRGMRLIVAGTEKEAARAIARLDPAAVIIGVTTDNLASRLRFAQERTTAPVLLLSGAQEGPAEAARALDLGADDYLVKPAHSAELAARTQALVRRANNAGRSGHVLRFADTRIDRERRQIVRGGVAQPLTRTEWRLLDVLLSHAGSPLESQELLERVWGPAYSAELRYLRLWVSRLRQKVEPDPAKPRFVRTLPGRGYMFDPSGGSTQPTA